MSSLSATFKDLGLKSIFNGQETHDKGNELDGVFSNIRCRMNQMIPTEGLDHVINHKMLVCRFDLEGRSIKRATQKPT